MAQLRKISKFLLKLFIFDKNLLNLVSSNLKLHNQYYHNVIAICPQILWQLRVRIPVNPAMSQMPAMAEMGVPKITKTSPCPRKPILLIILLILSPLLPTLLPIQGVQRWESVFIRFRFNFNSLLTEFILNFDSLLNFDSF